MIIGSEKYCEGDECNYRNQILQVVTDIGLNDLIPITTR